MGEGMSGMENDWMPPDGMGAAELLRKLAGDLLLGNAALYDYLDYGKEGFWRAEKGGVSIGRALELLADRIERETAHDHSEDVSMSAYDLLPNCDREAISLALDCGGVVEIRKRLMSEGMELDGNVLKVRTAENVDYDGETLFVLIGGSDE